MLPASSSEEGPALQGLETGSTSASGVGSSGASEEGPALQGLETQANTDSSTEPRITSEEGPALQGLETFGPQKGHGRPAP